MRRRAQAETLERFALTTTAGPWPLVGKDHPKTGVWCYDNRIPGSVIRVRQGEPVRIVVENKLDEDTTVHWHGIRLPNAMDGVPGLTQPPIKPGQKFVYEFTPPDAGTFWYHPHADSLRQLGRGLAGGLIVEEPEPVAVDRDLLWMLQDWRLTSEAQIAGGFGNAMEAAMSGRVGNTVMLNGAISNEVAVRAGERIRCLVMCAFGVCMMHGSDKNVSAVTQKASDQGVPLPSSAASALQYGASCCHPLDRTDVAPAVEPTRPDQQAGGPRV